MLAGTAIAQEPADPSLIITEYKDNLTMDVKVGTERVFDTNCVIFRTQISDPDIAEPVVICENQVMVLGKQPGRVTMVIWGVTDYFDRNPRDREVADRIAKIDLEVVGDDTKSASPSIVLPFNNAGRVALSECAATQKAIAEFNATKAANTYRPTTSRFKITEGKPYPNQNSRIALREGMINYSLELNAGTLVAFRTSRALQKTETSDISIAEPVWLSRNEFAILAHKSGTARFSVLDDKNRMISIAVRVANDSSRGSPNNRIAPVAIRTMELEECKLSGTIELEPNKPRVFEIKHPIVRVAFGNPGVAEFFPGTNVIYLEGKSPGRTSLFLWDDQGNKSGTELVVRSPDKQQAAAADMPSPPSGPGFPMAIQVWEGHRKNIQYWPISELRPPD